LIDDDNPASIDAMIKSYPADSTNPLFTLKNKGFLIVEKE
jgi:hypothetical protein